MSATTRPALPIDPEPAAAHRTVQRWAAYTAEDHEVWGIL